jgi:hypothetical protein
MRGSGVALVAALVWTPPLVGQGVRGDPPSPALVDRLLATTEIRSVLQSVAPSVEEQVLGMARGAGLADTEGLSTAIRLGFGEDALYSILRDRLATYGTEAQFLDVLAWAETGPIAQARELADSALPVEELERFARELQADPPPETRTTLILQLAEAQMTADFYVLIQEAVRESAHLVVAAVEDGVPAFTPMSEEGEALALQNAFALGVLSYLQRFRPVSDSLLFQVVRRYGSPEGQWYVNSYALALMETILEAADRVAVSLGGAPLVMRMEVSRE